MKPILCLFLLTLLFPIAFASAAPADQVVRLGLLDPNRGEAAAYNFEFRKYDRWAAFFRENHIEASLIEYGPLLTGAPTDEAIYKLLKPFHAVLLINNYEQSLRLNDALKAQVPGVRGGLERYVKEGGGLLLLPQALRYPNSDDVKFFNLVYAGLGISLLPEGLFDPTHSFNGRDLLPTLYWTTRNIRKHPITDGVSRLVLPAFAVGVECWPGVEAIKYSAEWEIVVAGEKEAGSFLTGVDNYLKLDQAGSCKSAPPIVGCRSFGKGRLACYPLTHVHAGRNFNIPGWDNTVELAGNRGADQPSFSLKLIANAVQWLAEPALGNPALGTDPLPPGQEVAFPPSVELDTALFGAVRPATIKGVCGAVSAHGGGKGTVANYARAAKAAGVSVLVFTDPLEKLTPATLTKLKGDCVAASQGNDFYACPGIEFTDGTGLRWALWGENVVYPEKEFMNEGKPYAQWNGQRINHRGRYIQQAAFAANGLLDYQQLKANGLHAENMWWFYDYFPWTYRDGKLAADNVADFLHGLSDLRWSSVVSYTRVDDPTKLAAAAGACFTGFTDIPSAKACLNSRVTGQNESQAAGQFVSQGPQILAWDMYTLSWNWKMTRGTQRARCRFVVRADDGIADVKVHDAEQGVYRRFLGNGEKELRREFEAVNDRTRWLTLEVTDTKGKRAFSWVITLYYYKQGLIRCGDNLNILGATGLIWHPDRNEMIPVGKGFENADRYTIQGVDGGGALCPVPGTWGLDHICTDKGEYGLPWVQKGAMIGKVLEVPLSSYNFQIARQKMTMLSEAYSNDKRPQPAFASLPRDIGPNEYFEREHTIYSPATRTDWYVTWDFRRPIEGGKDYRGGLVWNEGTIKFKKDVKLNGRCPIPLVRLACDTDVTKGFGDTLIATDASGQTEMVRLTDPKGHTELCGRIRPGGYASLMPTLVGYQGFLAPAGSDFAYAGCLPGWMEIGLGRDGQEIKAGTELTYRFAVASLATDKVGTGPLNDVATALNMGGGTAGYPIAMKAGALVDATFFLTAKAEKSETAFKAGPRAMIIDLPIKVQGLADNGCAAVYSSQHPWFRYVPVVEGAAYFQETIDQANEIWVGNIFTASHPALKITVVVDGRKEGNHPLVEVHNPTDRAIDADLVSPPSTPRFGGMKAKVAIPAGSSLRYEINGKQLDAVAQ